MQIWYREADSYLDELAENGVKHLIFREKELRRRKINPFNLDRYLHKHFPYKVSVLLIREKEHEAIRIFKGGRRSRKKIPIFTFGDSNFEELCQNYPYVMIRGIPSPLRERDVFYAFLETILSKKGKAKIHVTGVTNPILARDFYFDAIDYNPKQIALYGDAMLPDGRRINRKDGAKIKANWKWLRLLGLKGEFATEKLLNISISRLTSLNIKSYELVKQQKHALLRGDEADFILPERDRKKSSYKTSHLLAGRYRDLPSEELREIGFKGARAKMRAQYYDELSKYFGTKDLGAILVGIKFLMKHEFNRYALGKEMELKRFRKIGIQGSIDSNVTGIASNILKYNLKLMEILTSPKMSDKSGNKFFVDKGIILNQMGELNDEQRKQLASVLKEELRSTR